MKLTCASNCLNRIVEPTQSPLNHQFTWLLFISSNWISHPIYFSSDVSIIQCSIFKINCFNGFSSVRVFQRYIICIFLLPFDPFSISGLFFLLKIGFSRGRTAAGKKGQCCCPCGTHCQRKEQNGRGIVVRVSQVHVVYVGIRNAQIPLMLKLRKDRRTKILLLLKLGIKVCRIITESYRHLILYKRR
jgi:hypothetical protein